MGNSPSRCVDLTTYGGFVAGLGFLMMGAYAYSPNDLPPIVAVVGLGAFIAGGITAGVGLWDKSGKGCV